jgi:hypothetical protein
MCRQQYFANCVCGMRRIVKPLLIVAMKCLPQGTLPTTDARRKASQRFPL